MSIFNDRRLTNKTFKLDIDRMRRGWYSDKYFENVGHMLDLLDRQGYTFRADSPRLESGLAGDMSVANMPVEMQWFVRRRPFALVAGVDKALSMLRHCTGFFDGDEFQSMWERLEVEAVQDGVLAQYSGDHW